MSNSIGLGEYRVGHPGMDEWTMHGLGSCIGLIIACRKTYISAAAHIVLPMNPSAQEQNSGQPARYGREAVPFLINEMKEKRSAEDLFAIMVGGARMFQFTMVDDIGRRNIEELRGSLHRAGVPIVAEDVGGRKGRTLRWNPTTGMAVVTVVGTEERELTPVSEQFINVVTE